MYAIRSYYDLLGRPAQDAIYDALVIHGVGDRLPQGRLAQGGLGIVQIQVGHPQGGILLHRHLAFGLHRRQLIHRQAFGDVQVVV